MTNISKLTEEYISTHPSIKDCMKSRLINYSKLSRLIASEMNLSRKNFDAILIAARRYTDRLKKEEAQERKILRILKQSRLEIKNRIIAVVVEKNIYYESLLSLEKDVRKKAEVFHVFEGANAITIITSDAFLDSIDKLFKGRIIKLHQSLVEVILRSPKEIETVAGVIPFLYSLFGEHGINIVETMSCWTDTVFVVDEKDTAKVMEILKF